jgi:hypothetical protein
MSAILQCAIITFNSASAASIMASAAKAGGTK